MDHYFFLGCFDIHIIFHWHVRVARLHSVTDLCTLHLPSFIELIFTANPSPHDNPTGTHTFNLHSLNLAMYTDASDSIHLSTIIYTSFSFLLNAHGNSTSEMHEVLLRTRRWHIQFHGTILILLLTSRDLYHDFILKNLLQVHSENNRIPT